MPTPRAMFRILSVTCLLTRKALRLITRNRSLSNIGRASETALFRRQFHQLHDILVLTMKQMSYYVVCTFESAVARHIELAQ